jgi:hypothetical protein
MLSGPLIAEPAMRVEHGIPGLADVGLDEHRRRRGGARLHLRGQMIPQESADLVPEGGILGGKFDVHQRSNIVTADTPGAP